MRKDHHSVLFSVTRVCVYSWHCPVWTCVSTGLSAEQSSGGVGCSCSPSAARDHALLHQADLSKAGQGNTSRQNLKKNNKKTALQRSPVNFPFTPKSIIQDLKKNFEIVKLITGSLVCCHRLAVTAGGNNGLSGSTLVDGRYTYQEVGIKFH